MTPDEREALRSDLVRLLAENLTNINDTIRCDEPLISSGRINSLAIFEVALWIEERSLEPVDFTQVDITRAWDTIDNILNFIAQRQKS